MCTSRHVAFFSKRFTTLCLDDRSVRKLIVRSADELIIILYDYTMTIIIIYYTYALRLTLLLIPIR